MKRTASPRKRQGAETKGDGNTDSPPSPRRRASAVHPARIVVIGASAGGIEALCQLLARLPEGFHTPVFVVQHIGRSRSVLPEVLNRCGPVNAVHARHGARIRGGYIYVAPPNRHLIIRDGTMELEHGPRENRSRPAIDPLFRSAARAYRQNVTGILLSGELDDGVAGLFAIKARGGVTVVQDPMEAASPSMPEQAMRNVKVDHVLPLGDIAALLIELNHTQVMKKKGKGGRRGKRPLLADHLDNTRGEQMAMACPDCQGPLFQVKDRRLVKFHCIVGHSFSPVSLSDAHADALERALWVAIRSLKERLTLSHQLLEKHRGAQELDLARRIGEDAARIAHDIELLEEIQGRI